MNTEIAKVSHSDFGLEESQANEIIKGLSQVIEERQVLEESYKEVIKLEITQENLSIFKELRLKIRDNRTKGIETWHKVNKEFYLRGGQFVDAIKRKEVAENERMESNLMENEKFFERQEAERFEKEMKLRLEKVHKFNNEVTIEDVRQFNDENFQIFLSGIEKQYNDKIEQAKKEDEERIENDRLNKLEQERRFELAPYTQFITETPKLREMEETDYKTFFKSLVDAKVSYEKEQEAIRLDNERLKKEAEEKEKALQIERQKAKEEQDIIEKERLAELQIEKDKQAKLEAELKAKEDAELKAEKERLAQIELEKKEVEKLAKAPIKKQLNIWVNSFEIPNSPIDNESSRLIIEKFEAFKSWSLKEIEKL